MTWTKSYSGGRSHDGSPIRRVLFVFQGESDYYPSEVIWKELLACGHTRACIEPDAKRLRPRRVRCPSCAQEGLSRALGRKPVEKDFIPVPTPGDLRRDSGDTAEIPGKRKRKGRRA